MPSLANIEEPPIVFEAEEVLVLAKSGGVSWICD